MSSVRIDTTATPDALSSTDRTGDSDAFADAMAQAARPSDPAAQEPAPSDHGSWLHRGLGLLQAGVGVVETAGGAAFAIGTAETGVGALAGGVVALHGLDDIQAGLRQAWSGKPSETVTQTVATAVARHAGASPELAMGIGIGADIAAGGGLASGEKAAEIATDLGKAEKEANAAREVVTGVKGPQAGYTESGSAEKAQLHPAGPPEETRDHSLPLAFDGESPRYNCMERLEHPAVVRSCCTPLIAW